VSKVPEPIKEVPDVVETPDVVEATPVIETPEPAPLPTTNVNELEMLKAQVEKMEKMATPQEIAPPQELAKPEEPSEEDMEKFQQLQAEIERLQNDGVWRVEILYQLNKIVTALEKP